MKIKKYEAQTEQMAIGMVKDELGLEAMILNIKKTQPKGILSFFRKTSVEVTAAYDEKEDQSSGGGESLSLDKSREKDYMYTKAEVTKGADDVKEVEKMEKLNTPNAPNRHMLEQVVNMLKTEQRVDYRYKTGERKYENTIIQMFYEALTAQGVTLSLAEKILEDVSQAKDATETDLELIVKIVYNNVVNILGEPEIVNTENLKKGEPKIIIFIGPTGVGKTTTIAKLSSTFVLENKLDIGLITADTYRIAAVKQLKTYAEILGVYVGTAYNNEDLRENIELMEDDCQMILIDTAGRSHKNQENVDELREMLECLVPSERFLVLSTTTKYEDILDIVETYSEFTDFKIIFTKLDETSCLGSILNICYATGKKISYVTNGQNVPDDIEIIRPEKIAKALMGLGGV